MVLLNTESCLAIRITKGKGNILNKNKISKNKKFKLTTLSFINNLQSVNFFTSSCSNNDNSPLVFNLGSIYSKEFKSVLFKFIGNLSKIYKLSFYVYRVNKSGYKFRDEIRTEKIIILNINYNGELYIKNESIELENLIFKLNDNFYDHQDSIEKEFKLTNSLGEYSEPEFYIDYIDFEESLNSEIFVNTISD